MRRFRNEEFLRIALNDIHGHTPQGEGTLQLSFLADACLKQALEIAREELLPRFGLPFCGDGGNGEHQAAFAIVGMGKLGGMELNYHSDLDIIFIYEGEGETRPVAGDGPGALPATDQPGVLLAAGPADHLGADPDDPGGVSSTRSTPGCALREIRARW